MGENWQADLERWLGPYLEGLGNKTRRRMCPASHDDSSVNGFSHL